MRCPSSCILAVVSLRERGQSPLSPRERAGDRVNRILFERELSWVLISKSRALSAEEIKSFGEELDTLRKETMATIGKKEADYIYRVRNLVRYTEIAGRSSLMLGWLPPFWLAGASLLGVSKIIENMELGHNVIHGQYDWMNDPSLRGSNYEWDHASTSASWRHSHNYLHHTYTNVVGRDRDVGYTVLRLTDEQPWKPYHLVQPLTAAALAVNFQWGISLYDLELDNVANGTKSFAKLGEDLKPFVAKVIRHSAKDHVFFLYWQARHFYLC